MLHCWETEPESRPTFSNLVSSLSQSLSFLAGYVDTGAFGDIADHKPDDAENGKRSRNEEVLKDDPFHGDACEVQEVTV